MRRTWSPLLAYSTNVHPSESIEDITSFLENDTVPIQRRVFGPCESGLELRLGIEAARELKSSRARGEFRDFLRERKLRIFSVNAFPLLDFHARRVKEQVYRPSWAEPERSRWTNAIAGILADLMPEGTRGTVSTLGGVFRPSGHGPAVFRKLARGYLGTLEKLARIEQQRGTTIALAVEPEPDTTFETADDVIEFFQQYLHPAAVRLGRRKGLSRTAVEDRLHRFFTVNFDTCHFSVLFQDLRESFHRLLDAGIDVGKLHVTSAVRLRNPRRCPVAYRQFRGMHEPRYFHQFRGSDAEGNVSWRGLDLGELPRTLSGSRHGEVVELRSHYHVPLYRKRWKALETTRDETRDLVLEVAQERLCEQFVVETYTWPILAGQRQLRLGIARELSWLKEVLTESGVRIPGIRPADRARGSRSAL